MVEMSRYLINVVKLHCRIDNPRSIAAPFLIIPCVLKTNSFWIGQFSIISDGVAITKLACIYCGEITQEQGIIRPKITQVWKSKEVMSILHYRPK
jgi:hypothetical protein